MTTRLVPLDDIDVSELVVWTTGYQAEMVGMYIREPRCLQDHIAETIRAGVLDLRVVCGGGETG